MKHIIPCLLIMALFSQCKKDDPAPDPATPNIFNVAPDANYLPDTVLISRLTNEILYGFYFSYDNFNRVAQIKEYEYFYNTPVNFLASWTFNYQGGSNNPVSMDQVSADNYRVYFFYNTNGSKSRDSIVTAANPSSWTIRRYTYDTVLHYAVAKFYGPGSPKPAYVDTANFNNYNNTDINSYQIIWVGNTPYTFEWYSSEFLQKDNHPNPFSKLNIFPALFLAPYLQGSFDLNNYMWTGNISIDFTSQNNPMKYRFHDDAAGGYSLFRVSTSTGATYDANSRITRKDYVDSSGGTLSSLNFFARYYTTYKYK